MSNVPQAPRTSVAVIEIKPIIKKYIIIAESLVKRKLINYTKEYKKIYKAGLALTKNDFHHHL